MKGVFASVVLILMPVLAASCQVVRSGSDSPSATAEPTLPLAMKGYELYSWQIDSEWYFSLLEGTNRLKTFEEVTAETAAVKGIESIERKLGHLSRGEQVFWGFRNIPNLAMPPAGTVNEIKEFCARSGIAIITTE